MALAIVVSHIASSFTMQVLCTWPLLVCYWHSGLTSSVQPLVTCLLVVFILVYALGFWFFFLPRMYLCAPGFNLDHVHKLVLVNLCTCTLLLSIHCYLLPIVLMKNLEITHSLQYCTISLLASSGNQGLSKITGLQTHERIMLWVTLIYCSEIILLEHNSFKQEGLIWCHLTL